MANYIAIVALLCVTYVSTHAHAQPAHSLPSSDVTWESINVSFTNLQVVTSEKLKQSVLGTIPENPMPLDPKRLYPPGTRVFLRFNYTTDFETKDDPKAIKSVEVGVEITKGFQGHGPCSLKDASGTAYVWFLNVFPDEKSKVAEVVANLVVYGTRNDNSQVPSMDVPDEIRFKISIDRLAQISETQFDAIKAMYKRLQDLEKRIKELESRQEK